MDQGVCPLLRGNWLLFLLWKFAERFDVNWKLCHVIEIDGGAIIECVRLPYAIQDLSVGYNSIKLRRNVLTGGDFKFGDDKQTCD